MVVRWHVSKGQDQEPVQTRGALLKGCRGKKCCLAETVKRASCAEVLVADGSEPEDDKS